MRGKLINFEGIDSSGKKTQTELLRDRLIEEGKKVETFKFPTYSETLLGEYPSRYLKGDFGTKEQINPYIGSLFYSIDRLQFIDQFKKKLKSGTYLILDRYKASNIFQAAKLEGNKRFELWEWVKKVEAPLPDPDAMIFLNVSVELSQKMFTDRETKNMLLRKGEKDIHEIDHEYQRKVARTYMDIAKKEKWIIVNCFRNINGESSFRDKMEIHNDIYKHLKGRKVV